MTLNKITIRVDHLDGFIPIFTALEYFVISFSGLHRFLGVNSRVVQDFLISLHKFLKFVVFIITSSPWMVSQILSPNLMSSWRLVFHLPLKNTVG